MKKQHVKIIVIIAVIALLSIGAFLLLRKKPKRSPEIIENGELIIEFPLGSGSSGYAVEQVQKYLNGKYNAGLTVDGNWGPVTDLAVSNYLNRDNISETVYYKWGLDKL
jgi:peptidoglycan hydrolase-like protein with peptidoglycan-binding domain